jgi:hypothetical protein
LRNDQAFSAFQFVVVVVVVVPIVVPNEGGFLREHLGFLERLKTQITTGW